jgi:hypothetical protein
MRWDHVIYVAGNHEKWYGAFKDTDKTIGEICNKFKNVYDLDNEFIDIETNNETKRIFGGTGWFKDPLDNPVKGRWPDYLYIKNLEPYAYHRNQEFQERAEMCKPDLVVSHHMPNEACVQPKYAGDISNHFYHGGFDVEKIGAKTWMFGHTHIAIDMMLGNTRAVCNPFGYPNEEETRNAFKYNLVVEI